MNQSEPEHEEWLQLSLSTGSSYQPPPHPHPNPPFYASVQLIQQMLPFTTLSQPPQPPLEYRTHIIPEPIPELTLPLLQHQVRVRVQDQDQEQDQAQAGPLSRNGRARSRKSAPRKEGWAETIEPPYPWATSRRAVVYGLEELLSKNINEISGEVECKNCKEQYEMEYDLRRKFCEVAGFIAENRCRMHHRAPKHWFSPVALNCRLCGFGKCVTPVIAKKRRTNWLFLLLGQMIGYCKLTHLKYFCKHTGIHRTGAKDRLLYLTYLGLCKQLDPNGPFDP